VFRSRYLASTAVSLTDDWTSCMADNTKKYWSPIDGFSVDGYCWDTTDNTATCSGSSVRCSDEFPHLPNNAKYLLCPFKSNSNTCGSQSSTITVNEDTDGLISTRILISGQACFFLIDIEDDEEFDLRVTNVIGAYVNVYSSSGDHSYKYINRIDTGVTSRYEKTSDVE